MAKWITKMGVNNATTEIDSLKKRYFFKLGVSLLNIPIGFVIQSFIARGLGVATYGNFTFLTKVFNEIVGFLDSGTSTCFYTKLSIRQREDKLIKFYWFFVITVSLIITLLIPVSILFTMQDLIFPNQEIKYIWLALLFALLTWDSKILKIIIDAYGFTSGAEILRFTQRILALFMILGLYFSHKMNLTTFFFYHYITILFLMIVWWILLKKKGVKVFPKVALNWEQARKYISEFYNYSHPLFIRSLIVLIGGLLSVWFLQKFGGSVEQGYFGFSFKLISITVIFSTSMTPLITREFSILFEKKELRKMRSLFLQYVPILYFAVGIMISFFFSNSENLSQLIGGEDFVKAKTAFALISFYPLTQTYGQLISALYYATGQTKLYRNVGLSLSLFGFFTTFLLLGPESMYGLNLGAVGMSLKIVISGFISVNILLWFGCKYLNMRFITLFAHQIYSVFVLILLALSSTYFASLLATNYIISLLLSGLIYTIFVVLLIVIIPYPFIFMNRVKLKGELGRYYLRIVKSKRQK